MNSQRKRFFQILSKLNINGYGDHGDGDDDDDDDDDDDGDDDDDDDDDDHDHDHDDDHDDDDAAAADYSSKGSLSGLLFSLFKRSAHSAVPALEDWMLRRFEVWRPREEKEMMLV